ncbi:MAG: hypothetical protein QOF70_6205 [Acetobacteraceae bacterium]|jgi:hypothetical protein|nr:hypothetical protein [Acetobacteraceae bacterium]
MLFEGPNSSGHNHRPPSNHQAACISGDHRTEAAHDARVVAPRAMFPSQFNFPSSTLAPQRAAAVPAIGQLTGGLIVDLTQTPAG